MVCAITYGGCIYYGVGVLHVRYVEEKWVVGFGVFVGWLCLLYCMFMSFHVTFSCEGHVFVFGSK